MFVFLCLYNDRMFMLFSADVSSFARPTIKSRRSHFSDINFFLVQLFLVTFRVFEGSEWVFSVPGSKIRAKIT